MTNRTLSPAAQVVFDAANDAFDRAGTTSQGLAAALRAVVQELKYFGITERNLLAIANELETQ